MWIASRPIAVLWLASQTVASAVEPAPQSVSDLAKPTKAQYEYHELERILFIHFTPGTWGGHELDDGKADLSVINPTKLNADQWCEAAKAWDAKMILFVAKHVGGFCWWPTDTTDYSIKNTPYRGGKGDVLREVREACRRNGLKFGVYIYPGDPSLGAAVGARGRTADPKKQSAFNTLYRRQLEEVWSGYGPIHEAWFDGSCAVPISDLVDKHLKGAAIFQSPHATIRWVGNERGIAPYPAWNSLSREDLESGVATAAQGDPTGDAWAPIECDVPLYNHGWIWSEENEKKRRSLKDLLSIYYRSVGRGAVLLLNATPNTDGLIPQGDMARYREFGVELRGRFSNPIAETVGVGSQHVIGFDSPAIVNQVVILEDYVHGERIRRYTVEAESASGGWVIVNEGTSVGRKRIVVFKPLSATKIRLVVRESVGEPRIKRFAVYNAPGDNEFLLEAVE